MVVGQRWLRCACPHPPFGHLPPQAGEGSVAGAWVAGWRWWRWVCPHPPFGHLPPQAVEGSVAGAWVVVGWRWWRCACLDPLFGQLPPQAGGRERCRCVGGGGSAMVALRLPRSALRAPSPAGGGKGALPVRGWWWVSDGCAALASIRPSGTFPRRRGKDAARAGERAAAARTKKPGGWRAPGLLVLAGVADRDAVAYIRLTVATACAT
ncbi:hypothetical protein FHY19_002792 [Xanthomonas arboricola]|nr:hypothetical protein [Xanthomonas sp. 4461]